ncbi:MAG TPA: FtsW/RodA/SpoVE family cell cycle protein, partial [Nitrospiria bacterium]
MTEQGHRERALLIIPLLLVVTGLAMIYSASAILADRQFGDSLYFLKRQMVWALIGVIVMVGFSRVPYPFWQSASLPLVLFSVTLLVMVLIPGVGAEVNGSRRWLRLGPFTAQPSELARLVLVLYLAHYLSAKREK